MDLIALEPHDDTLKVLKAVMFIGMINALGGESNPVREKKHLVVNTEV